MGELYDMKKSKVETGEKAAGMDLFGALIHGTDAANAANKSKDSQFDKSDIMGNAFVIMLAGHETTANALHYSMIYLALNVASQRHLQEDLDKILEGKPINEWVYEELFPRLFAGMPAAVMNETLRMLQPIINIPKSTVAGRPQSLTLDGKQYLVPGGVNINLCAAVHKNPRYWPPVSSSTKESDADKWIPERWLSHNTNGAVEHTEEKYDDEDLRGPSGADTSASLFKPVRGSYIPFSEGYRSCMGRRFAQVELLAVLAVIFREYSVELAVDEFASDEEVNAMPKGGRERKEVWKKAASKANHILTETLTSVITLQMRGRHISLRLTKRGAERFVFP